ncbi:hypothetical protein Tsubulata_021940 [Turnera subulata]|uniref:KIB1-4 beta-propeller domain-containing protein n=1 Tax=Turnera subulata TaxID=218843 RepID=A0A9Q0F1R1_9ROSI|nr:hypothetical protein Tsubulata_021940 [Turnera subulata]
MDDTATTMPPPWFVMLRWFSGPPGGTTTAKYIEMATGCPMRKVEGLEARRLPKVLDLRYHQVREGPAYHGVVGYHKGKFYVVSSTGRTLTVDPVSLEMKQVVPGRGTNGAIGSWRRKKKENLVVMSRYLVESSSGDLLVVDKCVPKVAADGEAFAQRRDLGFEFAVRKLDEQRQEWIPEINCLKLLLHLGDK